jgi:hypothetical protein
MYNCLFASFSESLTEGFITAYGEVTGPIMSKIFPTTFKFSSMTAAPILGALSSFTTRFCDGVTLRTLPNLCNNIPLSKNIKINVIRYLKFSAKRAIQVRYAVFWQKTS